MLSLFVTEDNRERGQSVDEANILSECLVRSSEDETDFADRAELFLKGSEFQLSAKFSERQGSAEGVQECDFVEQYDKSKRIKQIQCDYMMRVNDVLCSEKHTFRENLSRRLAVCDMLENSVAGALKGQKNCISRRLALRQAGRYSRQSKVNQTPSPCPESTRCFGFRALNRSGQSGKLDGCNGPVSPEQSFLSRHWNGGQPRTQFDFRTELKLPSALDTQPDTPQKTPV